MPRHHLLAVGHRLPAAVVVEGEGDVAELVGQPDGPGAGVVVEPGSLVAHEDAGTRSGAVGHGEGADHGAAVGLVGDVAGGGHGASHRIRAPRRAPPYWPACRGKPGRRLQLGFPAGSRAGAPLPRWCSRRAARARRRRRPPAPPRRATAAPRPTTDDVHDHDDGRRRCRPCRPRGRCRPGAPIALPFSADRVTAAESPDGAVFAAPQDPTSPSPADRLGGRRQRSGRHRRARPDRHRRAGGRRQQLLRRDLLAPSTPTTAPAATRTGSGRCRRCNAANSSNNDLVALAAAGGGVLRLRHPGQRGQRVPHQPGVVGRHRTSLVRGLGDAIGSDGSIYYESPDHHLAVRRPNGTATDRAGAGRRRPTASVAACSTSTSSPAARCGSASRPARASMRRTPPTTPPPSRVIGTYSGSVTSSVVDTAAGPLVLEPAGANAACPRPAPRPRRRASSASTCTAP